MVFVKYQFFVQRNVVIQVHSFGMNIDYDIGKVDAWDLVINEITIATANFSKGKSENCLNFEYKKSML